MSKMVPLPSDSIIPERDLDKTPVLEAKHLGIDFGGLTAVDDFNLLDGNETSGMNTVQVNKAGIARTFQNIRLFGQLTVEENVKVGLHNNMKGGMVSDIFRLPRYWKSEKLAHERAMELLSIFDMEHLKDYKAGSLPYGAQRRLEIVRALATNPCLLLPYCHYAH